MTLASRTKAVAQAGRSREATRMAIAAGGVAALLTGAQLDYWPVACAGALALGWALGVLGTNVDRMYLEGFHDGLVAATELGAAPAGSPGGDQADVGRLPGGAPVYGLPSERDGVVARALDDDQPGPPGAAGAPVDVASFATAAGIHLEPRPARPATDLAGAPISLAQGPRRSPFPEIPSAEPIRAPGELGRPPSRRKARRGISSQG